MWLGLYPLLLWGVGVVVGGGGAVLLAVASLSWSGSRFRVADIARQVVPSLLVASVALIAAVQANHHWLPDFRRPRSLALSVGILGILAFLGWLVAPAVGRLASKLLASGPRICAALVATLVVASSAVVLGPAPAQITELRAWIPAHQAGASPLPDKGSGAGRLVIVGLDGARWQVLEPLMQAGRLPHLASLVARGRRGILRNPDLLLYPSPVAWTTIMTGHLPEQHGVMGWQSTSRSRQAKALWEILGGFGWRSIVVNLPATYPAEPFAGVAVLAGEPAAAAMPGTSAGWWCTQSPTARLDAAVPCQAPGEADQGTRGRLVLRNPHGIREVFSETTPGLVLWALGRRLHARAESRLAALGPVVLELEVALLREGQGGAWRLAGWLPGEEELLFELGEGQWGPWLEARAGEERYLLRLRVASVRPGGPELFVSPFFKRPLAGFSSPAELIGWVERSGEPYLLGGDASSLGTGDPALVETHREALIDLARRRAEATLALMSEAAWDLYIHIFTLTDRSQHAFWRFREPGLYPPAEQPPAEECAKFGGAIDRAYELADGWLGEILARASPSALVLVVSDHGAEGGGLLPYGHHEDGIYLLAGPTVPPAPAPGLGPALELVDVVPILLAHLDLPLAEDLPGRIPPELAPWAPDGRGLPPPERLPSYGPRLSGGEARDGMDPALEERLRSLGYLE